MAFIEIDGVHYPRITIKWKNIVGDFSTVSLEDAKQLECRLIITEGYLFDCFEDDGEMYVRTFATYQKDKDEIAFGDRNCFPYTVLTRESKRDLDAALMFMNHEDRSA